MRTDRAIDVVLGATLLVTCAPLIVATGVLVLVSSGRPILHWSLRVGRDNRCFWMPKFRTMRRGAPDVATHLLRRPQSHVTGVGAVLRHLSLDELPQLLSIVRGDMTFIGPRPALHNQYDLIELRTRRGIHRLTPGLTGWAQVHGRDDATIEHKVELDEYYLTHRSLLLHAQILAMTVVKVALAQGVRH